MSSQRIEHGHEKIALLAALALKDLMCGAIIVSHKYHDGSIKLQHERERAIASIPDWSLFNMASRDMRSKTPIPSIDKTVVRSSKSGERLECVGDALSSPSCEGALKWRSCRSQLLGHRPDHETTHIQNPMDLACTCVKHQMRFYVCHQMRLLNSQRSSLRSLTFARFAHTFFDGLHWNYKFL